MSWQDGYWIGPLKDGYPPTFFNENGNFRFPWEETRQFDSDKLPDSQQKRVTMTSLSENRDRLVESIDVV